MIDRLKISKMRDIDAAAKWVASAITRLEATDSRLTHFFEEHTEYYDDVLYPLREAVGKLGYVLAGLTTWDYYNDDDDDDDDDGLSSEPSGAGVAAFYQGKGVKQLYSVKLVQDGKGFEFLLGLYESLDDAANAVASVFNDLRPDCVKSTWSNGFSFHGYIDKVGYNAHLTNRGEK